MISSEPLNGLLYDGAYWWFGKYCVLANTAMVSVNFKFGIRLRARLGEE